MYRSLLLLTILCISLLCGEAGKTTYENFSVVRFHNLTETDIMKFYNSNLDVWAMNKLSDWVDVMISTDKLDFWRELFPVNEITIQNVQTEIDEYDQYLAANPNPEFFDHFPTNAEVETFLSDQITASGGKARAVTIGTSYQGRTIRGIQIGTNVNAPILYLHCTIHAREWITTTTCCLIIDQLLNLDPDRGTLINNFNWIIVPVFNVDGYIYTHTSTRLWRKNRQPNSGSGCVGTDLNRNYATGWGGGGSSPDPCSDIYRGAAAFSGPESAGERTFLQNRVGAIAGYVDIHAYGGMFMSPWGYTYNLPPDYRQMETLMIAAYNGILSVNGRQYEYGTSANVIYIAAGGTDDWTYGNQGIIPSFTTEAWGSSFTPPASQIKPTGQEIYEGIKAFSALLAK
jgi:murein tripeptide amidase MpaA